jgi:hypothetical protein
MTKGVLLYCFDTADTNYHKILERCVCLINLKQFLDTKYDFLVSKDAYDLTDRNSFAYRRWSMIDMVWATVFIFRKGPKAKRIFDTIKYVKKYYAYFNEMYRVYAKNFRNDYAFAMALEQANGFINYDTLPFALATLPPDCEVVKFTDDGVAWQYNDQVTEQQDVHVLNKEIKNV